MNLYWPIFLVVVSNIFYHICAKSTPNELNPLASVLITYVVGGLFTILLYYLITPGANLLQEYTKLNWAPFILGFAIVGLEVGNIYMYKVGWNVNTGYIVQSAILAVALLAIGYLLYHEELNMNKVLGTLICIFGLYFINK